MQAVLDGALAGARTTLAKTPEMLPLLREAGVVDAGGQGFVVILEGMRLHLAGRSVEAEELPEIVSAGGAMAFDVSQMQEKHGADDYGYCTNYLLTATPGTTLDFPRIRAQMAAMGHSAVIVGDEKYVKAHIHTTDPGALLSYAMHVRIAAHRSRLTTWTMQVETLEERAPGYLERGAGGAVAVVAVAAGEGLSAVLRGLGAAKIVRGGQTMNPSTQELLDAIAGAPTDTVIVLPNNGNVVLSARQAAELTAEAGAGRADEVHPAGDRRLSAFTFTADLETMPTTMTDVASGMQTGEVTRAVRDATIGGVAVKAGEVIGLLDDVLTVAGMDNAAVTLDLLAAMGAEHAELVTLYTGAEVTAADGGNAPRAHRGAYPNSRSRSSRAASRTTISSSR